MPSLLHRHHDVEAGRAHIRDRGLQRRIGTSTTPPHFAPLVAAEAEIAHQLAELLQPPQVLAVVLGELDEQDRVRLAAHEGSSVGRNMAMSRASSIIVRSTSSTAMGSSLTMCWAASIAS